MRWEALVLAAGMPLVASVGTADPNAAASASSGCHVRRLTGLTLTVARERASHVGCALRIKGAPLQQAGIQTVERQSTTTGAHSSTVTVWLNPFCRGSAAPGPGLKEPSLTRGPTVLISGFYFAGGPLAHFSDPGCQRPAPPPSAGSVEVTNASGAVVATQTSTSGYLAAIPLPAGSYAIVGTFLDATRNGVHPTESESVVIPPGRTVRQDFVLSIP
jgi:hypothetical protein